MTILSRAALPAIAAAGLPAAPLAAATAGEARLRTMTLTGAGKVGAQPDIAHVTTGGGGEERTAREALTANSKAMAEVIRGLRSRGIAEKDIQTSDFSVGAQYRRDNTNGRPPKIRSYRDSNRVDIIVRDIARLGETLDAVVSLGSNTIGGMRFSIAGPKKLSGEARRRAVDDARRKAALYAQAAGVKLGPIMLISESGGARPQPLHFAAARMEAADAVPVQAGEQSLKISVSITWRSNSRLHARRGRAGKPIIMLWVSPEASATPPRPARRTGPPSPLQCDVRFENQRRRSARPHVVPPSHAPRCAAAAGPGSTGTAQARVPWT